MKSLAELQAIKSRMKDRVVLRDGIEHIEESVSFSVFLETEA